MTLVRNYSRMLIKSSCVCVVGVLRQVGKAEVLSAMKLGHPPTRIYDLRGAPLVTNVSLNFTAPGNDLDRGYGKYGTSSPLVPDPHPLSTHYSYVKFALISAH